MASNQSPAMFKTRHIHAANEKTNKPRVHTRHDNMKACSQWNTQAACHTAQDITWMHAADNTKCVQHNKTHVERRACGQANSRPHTPTKRQNVEHEYPNPNTKPKLKTWVPGSKHHAPTRNKARRQESALEAARSHETQTWREYQGSVTKPWITLDRSDRTLTEDNIESYRVPVALWLEHCVRALR